MGEIPVRGPLREGAQVRAGSGGRLFPSCRCFQSWEEGPALKGGRAAPWAEEPRASGGPAHACIGQLRGECFLQAGRGHGRGMRLEFARWAVHVGRGPGGAGVWGA